MRRGRIGSIMSCILARTVFWRHATEQTLVMLPPELRLVLGGAISGLEGTQRRLAFAWSKPSRLLWHVCLMGLYCVIQPCRCARQAPEECVQSSVFEKFEFGASAQMGGRCVRPFMHGRRCLTFAFVRDVGCGLLTP